MTGAIFRVCIVMSFIFIPKDRSKCRIRVGLVRRAKVTVSKSLDLIGTIASPMKDDCRFRFLFRSFGSKTSVFLRQRDRNSYTPCRKARTCRHMRKAVEMDRSCYVSWQDQLKRIIHFRDIPCTAIFQLDEYCCPLLHLVLASSCHRLLLERLDQRPIAAHGKNPSLTR